jgi:TRAP-type C4-dicarboxylate transport system substrate-binding protein
MNSFRFQLTAVACAAVVGITGGCSSSSGEPVQDKRGATPYEGKALSLTIGTDDSPGVPSADQISRFAEEVATLTDGKITIEPRWHAEGDNHVDWDQAVAAMVQDGELDLALGPTWAWDELGVTSLQPLQTPFLVDSDDLVADVIGDEDLAQSLMAGLDDAGVHGLSMWPEGLRHPFGFDRPLSTPDDYAGETIRSSKSRASTMLFNALGAKTSPAEPDASTMAGIQGEFVLNPNGIGVANVTFFAKVNLLYANADTYTGLTDEQRGVLADAAAATQKWAVEQTSDVEAGRSFCGEGGTVVRAADADVAALKEATAPVADQIAAAGDNANAIGAIEELKQAAGPPVVAPTCTGASQEERPPGKAEARLNGTYRFTVTAEEIRASGDTEEQVTQNAGVQTYVLEDGKVVYHLDPSEHTADEAASPDDAEGTYQVDGNVITFRFPVYENEVDQVLYEIGPDGDLETTFLNSTADNPTIRLLLASKPWERIK